MNCNVHQKIHLLNEKETYPKSFFHVGITVPNIHKAVGFYKEVMGWYIILPPSKVLKESKSAIGQMCKTHLVLCSKSICTATS